MQGMKITELTVLVRNEHEVDPRKFVHSELEDIGHSDIQSVSCKFQNNDDYFIKISWNRPVGFHSIWDLMSHTCPSSVIDTIEYQHEYNKLTIVTM